MIVLPEYYKSWLLQNVYVRVNLFLIYMLLLRLTCNKLQTIKNKSFHYFAALDMSLDLRDFEVSFLSYI